MQRLAFLLIIAFGFASSSAVAQTMATKATPPAPSSPWDIVVTGALMSDYNFRGITQSAHRPSAEAGFEPRYNFTSALEGYVGVSGESIDFPNRAAAEIDFYAGIRPTFGKLALDFGIWDYYYPGGQCFNTAAFCGPGATPLPNGNIVKQSLSFYEGYGKATYTLNDHFEFGGSIWGSPSVLNSGASGVYYTGNVTLTAPTTWFPHGIGAYVSADVGWWQLGTTDAFYGGVPLPSYANWDAGLAITWKVFTLDLRYYQSNLTPVQCNVFTSDQTATANAGGVVTSNWCGAAFIAKLSIDTSIAELK
jgi:uncharacterized protein (TIGR02001 family)